MWKLLGKEKLYFLWIFTLGPSFWCYPSLSAQECSVSSCFAFCVPMVLALLLLSPPEKAEQFPFRIPHASSVCLETGSPPWELRLRLLLSSSSVCVLLAADKANTLVRNEHPQPQHLFGCCCSAGAEAGTALNGDTSSWHCRWAPRYLLQPLSEQDTMFWQHVLHCRQRETHAICAKTMRFFFTAEITWQCYQKS